MTSMVSEVTGLPLVLDHFRAVKTIAHFFQVGCPQDWQFSSISSRDSSVGEQVENT